MLYTFSQAHYDQAELQHYLSHFTATDAVVLWQDGVLLALKQPQSWQHLPCQVFVLETDLQARGLQGLISSEQFQRISLNELVKITEKFSPQFAL